MLKKALIFLFVIAFFILFSNRIVLAREKIGIGVDQTSVSFDAEAGENQNFKINIKNISEKEEIIEVFSQDMKISDNSQVELMEDKNDVFGLKDWIWINEKDLILPPGGEKEIFFTLNVPDNASPGSHFSAVVFQAFPRVNAEDIQSTIVSGKIGVHILVNVKGEIVGKGKISRFQAPTFARGEVNMEVIYKNEGNIHYVPYGEIKVLNWLSRKEERTKLEKHFVFPRTEYAYQIKQNFNSFWGIYSAEAYFVDAEGNFLKERKIIFGSFFIPILVLILAALITFIRFYIKRTTCNRHSERSEES